MKKKTAYSISEVQMLRVECEPFGYGNGTGDLKVKVDTDGIIRVYDSVDYTLCHSLTEDDQRQIRRLAKIKDNLLIERRIAGTRALLERGHGISLLSGR